MGLIFLSKFLKVPNKNKHINAEEFYYYIKSTSGDDYLFTSSALSEANNRAMRNKEDIPAGELSRNPAKIIEALEASSKENSELYLELNAVNQENYNLFKRVRTYKIVSLMLSAALVFECIRLIWS